MNARSSSSSVSDGRHSRRRRSLRRTFRDAFRTPPSGGHTTRPSIGVRLRRSRKGVAGLTAASLLAGAVITGVVVEAAAALPENPYARVNIVKVYDGTGWDQGAQTFINAHNGYHPGDNTPTDGVVASGDVVGYSVVIEIMAAKERTIRVSLDDPELLEWAADLSTWSAPGTVTTVKVDGDDLVIKVPAGKVETLIRQVVMRAQDTAGLAIGGQVVGVSVGIDGQAAYSSASAPAVTVVSAPMADLTIRPSVNALTAQVGADASGTFIIEPKALNAPGYSSKGAAIAGQWRAWLDVSAFPEGTVFTLGSSTPLEVVDGKVRVEGSGTVLVGWRLPDGWPEYEPGATLEYAVRLIVDSDSFSTDGEDALLNNAVGWQPGDGEDRDFDTRDEATGATRGVSFMNNDWAAVRAHYTRNVVTPGNIWGAGKSVQTPRTPGVTLFDPESLTFAAATGTRTLSSTSTGQDRNVAPATELWTELSFSRSSREIPADEHPGALALMDSWDATEQYVDHTRAIRVTLGDGSVVDPSGYMVQWHTDMNAPTNRVLEGWQDGPAGPDAQALRIIVSTEAYDVHTLSSRITARVPFRVLDLSHFVQEDQGRSIDDKYTVALLTEENLTLLMSDTDLGHLVLPSEQKWTITESVVVTDAESGEVKPVAQVGDLATYTVVPGVANLLSASGTFNPTVTVTLDKCLVAPVLTEPSAWTMTITPAVVGDSGTVCGDETSEPAVLTFTSDAIKIASVKDLDGLLPKIVFSATVSNQARTQEGKYGQDAVTVGSTVTGSEAIGKPVAEANFSVIGEESTTANIDATPKVEVGDPFELVADIYLSSGHGSDHVIVLPREGDDALVASLEYPDQYGGPDGSGFQGSYVVTSVRIDMDNSSAGRRTLYYTTVDGPSLDVDGPDWRPVDGAVAEDLAQATAIRVVTDEQEGRSANTRVLIGINPDGNVEGDIYLSWLSAYKDEDESSQVSIPMPWPAVTEVVASTIAGIVWWDADEDGRVDPEETRQPAVKVTLHDADGNQVGEPVVTKEDGAYEFTNLHSGKYTVQVHRVDPGEDGELGTDDDTMLLPVWETYQDAYGVDRDVHNTASFYRKFMEQASDTSTVITLGVDSEQENVNFGYWHTEPHATVDKDIDQIYDRGAAYDVEWSVTVTNDGNTPIDVGELVDRMDSRVTDVTATLTPPIRAEILHSVGNYVVFAGRDGAVWVQNGTSAPVRIADGGSLVHTYTSSGYVVVRDAGGALWSHNGTATTPVLLASPGEVLYSYNNYVVFADGDGKVWSQSASGDPIPIADGGTIIHKYQTHVVVSGVDNVIWSQSASSKPVYVADGGVLDYAAQTYIVVTDSEGTVWSQVSTSLPVEVAVLGTRVHADGNGSSAYVVVIAGDGRVWSQYGNKTAIEVAPDGVVAYAYQSYVVVSRDDGSLLSQTGSSARKELSGPGGQVLHGSGSYVVFRDANGWLWSQTGSSAPQAFSESGDIVYTSGTYTVYVDSDGVLWSRSGSASPVELATVDGDVVYTSGTYVAFYDGDGNLWSQSGANGRVPLAGAGARIVYTNSTKVWIADSDNLISYQSASNPAVKATPADSLYSASNARYWVSEDGELWVTYGTSNPVTRKLATPGWEKMLSSTESANYIDANGVLWWALRGDPPIEMQTNNLAEVRYLRLGAVVYADTTGALWSVSSNGRPSVKLGEFGTELLYTYDYVLAYKDHAGNLWRHDTRGAEPTPLGGPGSAILRTSGANIWYVTEDKLLGVNGTQFTTEAGFRIVASSNVANLLSDGDGALWWQTGTSGEAMVPVKVLDAGWEILHEYDGNYVLSYKNDSLLYLPGTAVPIELAGRGWELIDAYREYFAYVDGQGVLRSRHAKSPEVTLSNPGWEIYHGWGGNIWYSDDNGVLWRQSGASQPVELSRGGEYQNGHGVGYVWYTDQDGRLWWQSGTSKPVEVVDGVDFTYRNRVASSGRWSPSSSIFWFTDLNGSLWRQNYLGELVPLADDVTIVGASGNSVWYVDGMGRLWRQAGTGAATVINTTWPPKTDYRVLLDTMSETVDADGFTTRTYPLNDLLPGESQTVWFRGTVLRPAASDDGDALIVNQAWFDSELTPFANTPQDYKGINDSDVRNVDEFNRESDPETDGDPSWQEDHVVVPVPAFEEGDKLGSISGVVWRDGNDEIAPDDIRNEGDTLVPGATVELILTATGAVVASTTTDAQGAYLFDNLPLNYGYMVRFTLPDPSGAWISEGTGPNRYKWSDVVPSTSVTRTVTPTAAVPDVTEIDAGYRVWSPEIIGIYGIPGEDGVTFACMAPDYTSWQQLDVPVTFRNTGLEALYDLSVEFTGTHLVTGLVVPGYTVTDQGNGTFTLEGADLAVGGELTGTITVLAGECGVDVDNLMTVHGRGKTSNLAVASNDPYTAESPLPEAHLVVMHVIEGTNETLADPVETSAFPFTEYLTDELTGDALVKDGLTYVLVAQPENADGNYGDDGTLTEVIYVYKRVTVIPEDGNIDLPLPPIGGSRDVLAILAGALALTLLLGQAAKRGARFVPAGVRPVPMRRRPQGRHFSG